MHVLNAISEVNNTKLTNWIHVRIMPLHQNRPVGWSGDGGVRETMRVELTSGGGAFPEVWGLPHRGLGRSPSSFATFTMLKSQNIAYIYIIA